MARTAAVPGSDMRVIQVFQARDFDPGSARPRFAEWGPDGISTGLASPRMIWVEWLGLLVIDKTVQHYEQRCQKYSR